MNNDNSIKIDSMINGMRALYKANNEIRNLVAGETPMSRARRLATPADMETIIQMKIEGEIK